MLHSSPGCRSVWMQIKADRTFKASRIICWPVPYRPVTSFVMQKMQKNQEQVRSTGFDLANIHFQFLKIARSAFSGGSGRSGRGLGRSGRGVRVERVCFGDLIMPHHGTDYKNAESRSSAAQQDTYPNRETVFNYERALLECASGSQQAVGEIYAREKDQLRAVAHGIVQDMSRAEDVIHDAFALILRFARDFDPERGSARGWIYAIVRNRALKTREKARRELAFEGDTLSAICERGEHVPNPASCIPDSMALRTILDQLEPNRRASVLLAIIDGRTHEEIAGYLRVPVGTVKAWIRRELMAMRRRLE
jgi:RNA polymerase sigma-70 factor, ECF subfamily